MLLQNSILAAPPTPNNTHHHTHTHMTASHDPILTVRCECRTVTSGAFLCGVCMLSLSLVHTLPVSQTHHHVVGAWRVALSRSLTLQ